MDGGASNRSATIRKVFETMEYGEIVEKATNFTWLKDDNLYAYTTTPDEIPTGDGFQLKNANNDEILCNIYNPARDQIERILTKPASGWMKLEPVQRASLIYKLASELRKSQGGICQAETAARGIHAKETKEHLRLLTDHLEYYAGFSFKADKPEGLSVGIFSDQTALFLVGSNLGPALAAGYDVVLVTEFKISYVVSLLVEVARIVGLPEGTIRLIPNCGDNLNLFFVHHKVGIVSIFGHHHSQQFNSIDCSKKQVFNYSTASGIQMLVFDSADLDSACQSVLKAVWGYQGMLPWNVRNILVQENISDSFYNKLKQALSLAKIGHGNVRNADVAYPIEGEAAEKLARIVEASRKQGIEVFQTGDKKFPLTVLSGNPFTNNVVTGEDPIDVPLVVLTAFRTVSEAVNLANNTKQGLAASVWTDSLSLANEVVGKLQVTTIWINSHGMFSPEVSVTPYKNSGRGSFGGKTGFYEFSSKKSDGQIVGRDDDEYENDNKNGTVEMEKAIVDTKKARASWAKASRLERFQKLEAVITAASKNNKQQEHAKLWLEALFRYESHQPETSYNSSTFSVTVTREPRGVIAMEIETADVRSASLTVTALMEGNAVIVLAANEQSVEFCSPLVASGILKVLPKSLQASRVAAVHKELDVYLGSGPKEAFAKSLGQAGSKFHVVPRESYEAIRKATLVKSVWSNIGQSFV